MAQADPESEWVGTEEIGDDFIRQGDLLIFQNTADEVGLVRYGLVITADCDIVQRKTRGWVSYVPVISLAEYVFRFWIPELIESKGHATRCLDTIRQLVLDRMREELSDAKPLSDAGLYRLAQDGLRGSLAKPDVNESRAKRLCSQLTALRSLIALRDKSVGPSMEELRHHARAFFEKGGVGTLTKLLDRAADSVKEAVTGGGSLDIYPVGSIAAVEDEPYLAMLRFVRSVPELKVTCSLADFRYGAVSACRIGRLRPDAKHECLQRFGRLFVRAGKPDSINDACKRRIDAAIKLLAEPPHG